MDKTPIHSNLSRRGARNNKATELPTSATDRVVLDFALDEIYTTSIQTLYGVVGTSTQQTLNKLKANCNSRRQTFFFGDNSKIESDKEIVLSALIHQSGKALPEVLSQKKAELVDLKNKKRLTEAENQLLTVLKWLCDPKRINPPSPLNSNKKKVESLRETLISLAEAVTLILTFDPPPGVSPDVLLAAQKQFVGYLLQAVFRNDCKLSDYENVIDQLVGSLEDDDDYQTKLDANGKKAEFKKQLVRKIFGDELGAQFDDVILAYYQQYKFIEGLVKFDAETKKAILSRFFPSEKWVYAHRDNLPPLASLYKLVMKLEGSSDMDSLDGSSITGASTTSASLASAADDGKGLSNTDPHCHCVLKVFTDILTSMNRSGNLQWLLDSSNRIVSPDIGGQLCLVAHDSQSVPSSVPHLGNFVPDDSTTTAEDLPNVYTLDNILKNRVVFELLQLLTEDELKEAWETLPDALREPFDHDCSGSDSQNAGAGLARTENDFNYVGFLGSGSYATVLKALLDPKSNQGLRTQSEITKDRESEEMFPVAVKLQTMTKKRFAKLFLRQLLVQSALRSKYVVFMLGWFIVRYQEIVDELDNGGVLPNKITVGLVMELGDSTLEHFRLEQLDEKKIYQQKLNKSLKKSEGKKELYNDGMLHWYKKMLETNLAIVKKVLEGLMYCHSLGMLHRDVKTENIIFVDGHPKIGDFGTATFEKMDPEAMGTKDQGTYGYDAPETLQRKYFPASDLYSFGCTLYELVTGELPMKGGDEGVFELNVVGPKLKHLIEKLLQENPEDRIGGEVALTLLEEIIQLLGE